MRLEKSIYSQARIALLRNQLILDIEITQKIQLVLILMTLSEFKTTTQTIIVILTM